MSDKEDEAYLLAPISAGNLIREERKRQDKKWGFQNHNLFEWLAILMEEVGELSQAGLECRRTIKPATFIEQEAVHVAAVAFAILEQIERNRLLEKPMEAIVKMPEGR